MSRNKSGSQSNMRLKIEDPPKNSTPDFLGCRSGVGAFKPQPRVGAGSQSLIMLIVMISRIDFAEDNNFYNWLYGLNDNLPDKRV